MANLVSQDTMQLEMFRILRDMQRNTQRNSPDNCNGDGNGGGGCGGQQRQRNRKTPNNASFARQTMVKYCWTYGGYEHDLSECSRKVNGHKDTAIFVAKREG